LRDRTARERMTVLRAEVSASARSRAEKGGANGVLQILRRVRERCEHMNEVTILAPNEVVEQLEASERLPQDGVPAASVQKFTVEYCTQ
jgi:hypothetical protein